MGSLWNASYFARASRLCCVTGTWRVLDPGKPFGTPFINLASYMARPVEETIRPT